MQLLSIRSFVSSILADFNQSSICVYPLELILPASKLTAYVFASNTSQQWRIWNSKGKLSLTPVSNIRFSNRWHRVNVNVIIDFYRDRQMKRFIFNPNRFGQILFFINLPEINAFHSVHVHLLRARWKKEWQNLHFEWYIESGW